MLKCAGRVFCCHLATHKQIVDVMLQKSHLSLLQDLATAVRHLSFLKEVGQACQHVVLASWESLHQPQATAS